MIGIEINNQKVSLSRSTSMTFSLNSTGYFGDDVEVMPGSFSFPVSITMDANNRSIFGNQFLVDTHDPKGIEYDCMVDYAGVPLFSGRAKLLTPSPEGARLEITIVDFEEIKEKPLNEFELGGVRNIGNDDNQTVAHALQTVLNPEDYDYIFFPIWNPEFSEKGGIDGPFTIGGDPSGNFQNNWVGSAFSNNEDALSAMPFVKLNYLLNQIFQETKFDFDNQFQTTTELQRICLYNNYSIYTSSGKWAFDIDLRNHVSSTEAGAFLKKIIRTFCLFPAIDFINRTIQLIPCNNVIDATPKQNWSDKVLRIPQLIENSVIPGVFRYAQDDQDDWIMQYQDTANIPNYMGEVDTIADIPAYNPVNPSEIYWVKSKNWFYVQQDLSGSVILLPVPEPIYRRINKDVDQFTYESELALIHTEVRQEKFNGPQFPADLYIHAAIYSEGTIPHLDQFNEFNDRLIMYRGEYSTLNFPNYPFASSHNYDQDENRIGDYSLAWDGPDGIFEKWWKKWYDMLAQKKEVDMTLQLTLQDILNFNFADKVRIHNQNYLVKSLEITFTMDGIQPVQAHLITVV